MQTLHCDQYCEGAVRKPISVRWRDPTVKTPKTVSYNFFAILAVDSVQTRLFFKTFGYRGAPLVSVSSDISVTGKDLLVPLLKTVCDVKCIPCYLVNLILWCFWGFKFLIFSPKLWRKCLKILSLIISDQTGVKKQS